MKYVHIGWCKEDKHDKVWGVIMLSDVHPGMPWHQLFDYVTFWGRRGAKLQTKLWKGRPFDASEMFHKKKNKGYEEIGEHELDEVYPEFKTDLEKTAFWATLKI